MRKQNKTPNVQAAEPLPPAPCSVYWPLFKHMADEHNLTLLESEMEDICQVVERMRMPILCRHLTGDMIVMAALEAMSGPASGNERAKFTEILLAKLKASNATVTPNTPGERPLADSDVRRSQ